MNKHGSPQFGSVDDWQPRLARGLDELVPAALNGIRKMPRMGGNPALSDRELARAVIYMMNAAGGRFDEPEQADLQRWRDVASQLRQKH